MADQRCLDRENRLKLLVTGASGFLSSHLIPLLVNQGHTVFALSRHPVKAGEGVHPLSGDITTAGLGIDSSIPNIDAVIHCAAMLNFNDKNAKEIILTNVEGTRNVLEWMYGNGVSRLYYVSTAYLFRQNCYEKSKEQSEWLISQYGDIKATIFRPSIIIGDRKLMGLPPPNGLYLVIKAVDTVKRWIEDKVKLPNLRVTLRVGGNPDGHLNIVPVCVVAENIAQAVKEDKTGILYLTNPSPPTIGFVADCISEAAGVDFRIVPEFDKNPAEKLVARMVHTLDPYLQGHDLKSDIECEPLTSEFITQSIRKFLGR
jgi:nucleoside-diphosphate-sugar epimerase